MVSKHTSFHFLLVSKIKLVSRYFQLVSFSILKVLFTFNWYLKNILFIFNWYHNLVSKVLICITYMQGELNIFSIYRFMLSVCQLRSLTALLYVLHVCRRSFTSPFIHFILCFMWLGFSHLFSYKCMYVRGVNFTSLLFMNGISHI